MKTARKIIATGFILALSLLSACGKKEDSATVSEKTKETINTGKGRYVEYKLSTPEIDWTSGMFCMEDGSLYLCDKEKKQVYQSDVSHESWSEKTPNIFQNISDLEYVEAIAFAKNGDCMLEYVDTQSQEAGGFNPSYAYIHADGTVKELNLQTDDNAFFLGFAISDDNRVFGYTFLGSIYEINVDTGKMKLMFKTDGAPVAFSVTKHNLIAADASGVYFYNLLENKCEENNNDLDVFLEQQNIDYETAAGSGIMCFSFIEEEDGTYYILCKNGIYHFAAGETTVEQIVDGTLNSINNPSYQFESFIKEKDGSFLISYTNGEIMRYSYDANVSSTPEHVLKIYSLFESQGIRQVISEYQNRFPDYKIEYEIGMTENSAITYEDAVKNLNTELMSGNAPDIMVMDHLDYENYVSKGMLMDLSENTDKIHGSGEFLTNISEGLKEENGMHAIVTRYQIPMIVARKDMIDKITDYKALAKQVLEIRKNDTNNRITSQNLERDVLINALDYYGTLFSKEKGVDEAKLKELLECSKDIYESEAVAIGDEDRESFEENMDEGEVEKAYWLYQVDNKALRIASDDTYIATGRIYGLGYDFNLVTSLVREYSEIEYHEGLYKNDTRFFPSAILGITTSCKNKEAAVEFIATACSKEIQSLETMEGLPVNLGAIQDTFDANDENDTAGYLGIEKNKTDEVFELKIRYPMEKQNEQLLTSLKKLDTPVLFDKMLCDTIFEQGRSYIRGEITVEEAVKRIADKSKIRLAE